MSNIKPFIDNIMPEFVSSDHPKFKLFIEAYYEWLETQNSGEANSVKETFKELKNPAAIVNEAQANNDIDTTVSQYLEYFKSELVPIAIEANKVGDRFFLKKIRDVYLSKGTLKSFQLLFRMLYDEEVDIFTTKANIVDVSEGNYIAFPTGTFKVTQNANLLSEIDFTLAPLTKAGTTEEVGLILSGTVVGRDGNDEIISVQLNESLDLTIGDRFVITDPTDSAIFIEVETQASLNTLSVKPGANAGGYIVGDSIRVRSKKSGNEYLAIVNDVNLGSVTGLTIRNRGEFFSVGDVISFVSENIRDGSGGSVTVTDIDSNGRILEIDGTRVRTGDLFNGHLADDFEDVTIPVTDGGSYRAIPDVHLVLRSTNQAQPYGKGTLQGRGAQISAISNEVGFIADINIVNKGFFDSEGDVEIIAPMNLTIENPTEFQAGSVVSIQRFAPNSEAFRHDSELVTLTVNIHKDDSDFFIGRGRELVLPIGFDEDLFQWESHTFIIDSDNGIYSLSADSDWEERAKFTYIRISDSETDSDTFKVSFRSTFVDSLDGFHFDQLARFERDDSEAKVTVVRSFQNPTLEREEDDNGDYVNTGYFGRISRVSENKKSISLVEFTGLDFPEDSDLEQINRVPNTLLRIVEANPDTGEVILEDGVAIAGIISNHNRADQSDFEFTLAAAGVGSRTFLNEDGFLNSASGGIIQDNYFYSNYTYVVQTKTPITEWRESIKRMLHPAGMYLFGELNVDVNVDTNLSFTGQTDYAIETTSFTFDASQDYFQSAETLVTLNASNTRYESNAFETIVVAAAANTNVRADHEQEEVDVETISQTGNSWWDYEPLGLARRFAYVGPRNLKSYYNADSDFFLSNVTSHSASEVDVLDSENDDRTGYERGLSSPDSDTLIVYDNSNVSYYPFESRRKQDVNYELDLFAYYDSDKDHNPRYNVNYNRQENWKDVRLLFGSRYVSTINLDNINFSAGNNKFDVYDSDVTRTFDDYVLWSDEAKKPFRRLDYRLLRDSDFDPIRIQTHRIDRKHEISVQNAKDFNEAMKLDGSFTFTDPSGTYRDFEAYERKWNYINGNRDQNTQGWEINGWSQTLQTYYGDDETRQLLSSDREEFDPLFSNLKTPLNPRAWGIDDSENYTLWYRSYLGEINNNVFDINNHTEIEDTATTSTWRDPYQSMKDRRSGS